MTGEQLGDQEHEGEKYLRLLGLEHLAEQNIALEGGESLQARDFLEVCGEHARPILMGFETMQPDDPRYEPTRDALRGLIGRYIQGEATS